METIVGVGIVAGALVLLTVLTVFSRRRINRLSEQDFPNAREAIRNMRDGK